MYDIITFGSATSDVFLRLNENDYQIKPGRLKMESQAVCLPLGAKLFLTQMQTASGGGGTNAACTLAKQGFSVAYCGRVGDDKPGLIVLDDLIKNGVATNLCNKDAVHATAFSAVLTVPKEERTVLIYHGACHFMTQDQVPWEEIKQTGWFYLAPLSNKSADLFAPLVHFARENRIKVAANLGHTQISMGQEVVSAILSGVDLLILNSEEAASLTSQEEKNEDEIIRKVATWNPLMTILITKGKEGALTYHQGVIYECGIINVPVVEKTGAGDAFGSGFLAGFLHTGEIEFSLQLAAANATGCILEVGAKNGILNKGDLGPWPKVAVQARKFVV